MWHGHRRSVAVMCMLYKIRCNPMHHLYGAIPLPYVPVVARGALAAHWYTYAPRFRTSQYRKYFFSSQCHCGTIMLALYSMVLDWWVSRAGPMLFLLAYAARSIFVFYCFSLSLLAVHRLVLWGWGLWTDRVYITLSQPCTADLF